MTEQESIETTTQTAGEQLAQARKERNWSVADVAAKLRIAPRQIDALEADDYARLPGHTIARGFARNYARLLQLDADSVLEAFEKRVPKGTDARITLPDQNVQFSESGSAHHNRLVLWLSLGILLLTGVGFAVWQWDGNLAQRGKANAPLVTLGAVPKDVAQSAPSPAAAVSPEVATVTTPLPVSIMDHVVHLAFDAAAWVEIRDQSGKVVWVKHNQAGTEQDITAVPPMSFTIGNATKVKMTYNGDAFDLAPHIQGNIARFKLER